MAPNAVIHAPLETHPEIHVPGRAELSGPTPGGTFSPIYGLQHTVGNRAFGDMLEKVMLQRKCACGGTCSSCQEEELHRKEDNPGDSSSGNEPLGLVHDVVRSPGQPLDRSTRGFMESRFGEDFSKVRVHTDAKAGRSANSVNALAYTVGSNVVFGPGQFAPQTSVGKSLLAHELAHVVQQRTGTLHRQSPATSSPSSTAGSGPTCNSGLSSPPASGFWVCSRPAKGFNHTYIVAPPFRYALIKRCRNIGGGPLPLVSGADLGLPLNPTAARTVDHSPDPCNGPSQCCECRPRPGVTNLGDCFRRAFTAYPSPSEYVVYPGPNSNTFGRFMAQACCEGMATAPPGLGTVPGWSHSPAASVRAVCPADPHPNSCDDPPRPIGDRIGHGLQGMVALGLLGAGAGALTGAGIGAIIGSIIPGIGTLIGAGIGAAWGAGIGGALGGVLGLIAGLL